MKHLTFTIAIVLTIIAGAFFIGTQQTEAKATLNYQPEKIIQGEPIQIIVKGAKKSDIVSATFSSTTVPMALYNKTFIGFAPIDISKKAGIYEIKVLIKDSKGKIKSTLIKKVNVALRVKAEAPLGIPEKLGGNTASSQKQLIDTLAIENKSLMNLGTKSGIYWKKAFIYPVKDPVVTDPYGYSRLTGAYTITHKGTDFRAPVGTEIYAVNDGVVKLAQLGRNYGNTIAIDHGNGIQSFYMHLSEMKVKPGEEVKRGELIGLSGMTGYAEAAHLHFTLRINDVSVDPEVFLGFFK